MYILYVLYCDISILDNHVKTDQLFHKVTCFSIQFVENTLAVALIIYNRIIRYVIFSQLGIPNSRLRYFLIAKALPDSFSFQTTAEVNAHIRPT